MDDFIPFLRSGPLNFLTTMPLTPFTNDDIQRLADKARIARACYEEVRLEAEECESLMGRLEAAETICRYAIDSGLLNSESLLVRVWRASAVGINGE